MSDTKLPPAHVAFVIANLGGGGAQRVVLNIVEEFIRREHRIDLLLLSPHISYARNIPKKARLFILRQNRNKKYDKVLLDMPGKLVQLDVPTPTFKQCIQIMNALKWNLYTVPGTRMFYRATAVAAYLEREQPDYVFPNLPDAKVATLLAGSLVEKCPPIIPIVHSVMLNRRKRVNVRYRVLFPKASRCIAVSEGVADSLSSVLRNPDQKLTTIYNPVLAHEIERLSAAVPNHPWFADEGPPIVLAAGRFTEVKDFPTLIKAFSRLSKERPCRLIILGKGSRRPQLEELVRTLELQDRVSLPGWAENPYAFMARAALFVLSSRYEGLAMVLLEALACGCPCVSTDCPAGPAEILEGGKIGHLVPVGDEVALANAMRHTLDTPTDKEVLRSRAQMFSLDRAIASYEEVMANIRNTSTDRRHE